MLSGHKAPHLSCGFLSTYPPTQCGLATFAASLVAAMAPDGSSWPAGVVRLVDRPTPPSGRPEVVHQHLNGSGSVTQTCEVLSGYDVVVVQHEYGIFGGSDGEEVVELLNGLTSPVIVVLHTVLVSPTVHQREVLEQVLSIADAVVTMTRAARRRLIDRYNVDSEIVVVIPHGAHGNLAHPATSQTGGPTILTWGLLGPGKGIEWGIDALAGLGDLDPSPYYVIAGDTHPKVREREGEAYRDSLRSRARALGVEDRVVFADGYRDVDTLTALICSADVVLLPYDSRDQVTSGVLIEAVASLRPVVSTAFPHAVELLGGGAGLVVDHEDAAALSSALRRVLTEPGLSGQMQMEAALVAPHMLWPAVGERYLALADQVITRRSHAVA